MREIIATTITAWIKQLPLHLDVFVASQIPKLIDALVSALQPPSGINVNVKKGLG